MIFSNDILTQRLFEVIASLTEEEKAEWRESLIAWAKRGEEKA